MMSSTAWSFTITEVGGVDTFVGTFNANGSNAEAAGFAQVLAAGNYDYDPLTFDKVDNSNGWGSVTGTTWAAKLDADAPAFFSLKFGGGQLSGDNHYVYKNELSYDYLVVDLANLNDCAANDSSCQIVDLSSQTFTVISHYEKGGVIIVSAPEPSTIALLGLGLLGLATIRRKVPAQFRPLYKPLVW